MELNRLRQERNNEEYWMAQCLKEEVINIGERITEVEEAINHQGHLLTHLAKNLGLEKKANKKKLKTAKPGKFTDINESIDLSAEEE